jgi:hypothetical protein
MSIDGDVCVLTAGIIITKEGDGDGGRVGSGSEIGEPEGERLSAAGDALSLRARIIGVGGDTVELVGVAVILASAVCFGSRATMRATAIEAPVDTITDAGARAVGAA